ncbi:hypothetical protein WKW47_03350 [Staphylococcus nepalensis]|uniref:hypothetical protein n=1 Tax=Staphylococcus nepalensis TaxID=214473 RepID=UPI003F494336
MDYFMPPSLYWKLFKAYFKGQITIDNEYKHLDLIDDDGLLENFDILHEGKRVENNMIIFGKPYAGKYRLTTYGKKTFLKTTKGLGYIFFTIIGVVIGWCISLFF